MANGLLPAVSIGMPVYNGERFLKAALDSLLTQTFKDFELIISDNASTDGTERICKEYAAKDGRIRYIRQPENKGAGWNFNFVLREARGQYFMWAASDDMWDNHYVEALVKCIDSDPACIGAFGDYVFIGEESCEEAVRVPADAAPCWPITIRFPELLGDEVRIRRVFALARYRDDGFIYGLFRSKVIKKVELRPWRLARDYPQDCAYPLLFYLITAGKVLITHRTRFFYRVHPNQSENISLMAVGRIRLNHIFSASAAVWRASHSLLTALVAFLVVAFYQSRSFGWQAVRTTCAIQSPKNRNVTTG